MHIGRHVLALLLLCGTAAMAQSPGYWAFVRSETFDSGPYLGDASCPGEVIRIDQIDSRVVKVIHTVPASCNYNKATVEQHRHEWTELQNTIAVGEVPKFTATSTVIELTNTTGPFGGTTIFCGFVAYDAADKVSPNRDVSLGNSTAYNASGVGSSTSESNEGRAPAAQLKMPAGPWMGSGGNNGLIRFRVNVFTGTRVWRSIDKIYQWTSTAPKITSSVNGVTFQAGMVPGSWVSIFGTNLSGKSREWVDGDFVGGNRLPTSLEGVRVNINGRAAFVSYVSPGQLNVLAPDDSAVGPVTVEVINSAGQAQATAQMAAFAPGLFHYDQGGGTYVIALTPDWSYLAKPGLIPGVVTRAARPGETIVLYGTGFGPTNPKLAPDVMVAVARPLANALTVTIGGVPANIDWVGQVGSGLYQINLKVPAVPSGDQPIVVQVAGVRSPEAARITIQQ